MTLLAAQLHKAINHKRKAAQKNSSDEESDKDSEWSESD
jgi:hypothetical protein